MNQSQIASIVGKGPKLLTLLFTLNELYTSSISKTTAFLLKLTIAAKPGSLLLVVDSPGSYSETAVGNAAKKYPMHFLLNHTLIGPSKPDDIEISPDWEKVVSDDSRWFRIPEGLRYPISLENMRYQIHLYRRI
jgi:25S rRNA (uracil2843-N3)-methyltransferase